MGTSVWDRMPLIVWVVPFAWMHKRGPRADLWGGYSCVALRSNYRRQDWLLLWDFLCETSDCFCSLCREQRGDNAAFISSSEAGTVPLEGMCAVSPAGLTEVATGEEALGTWSPSDLWEVHSPKQNRHKNLNVDARREASLVIFSFLPFLSSWIVTRSYLEPLGLNNCGNFCRFSLREAAFLPQQRNEMSGLFTFLAA